MKHVNLFIKCMSVFTAAVFLLTSTAWAAPQMFLNSGKKMVNKNTLAPKPVNKQFSTEQLAVILNQETDMLAIFDTVFSAVQHLLDEGKSLSEVNKVVGSDIKEKVDEYNDENRVGKKRINVRAKEVRVIVSKKNNKDIYYIIIPYDIGGNLFSYIVRNKEAPVDEEANEFLEKNLPLLIEFQKAKPGFEVEIRDIPETAQFMQLVDDRIAKLNKDEIIKPKDGKKGGGSGRAGTLFTKRGPVLVMGGQALFLFAILLALGGCFGKHYAPEISVVRQTAPAVIEFQPIVVTKDDLEQKAISYYKANFGFTRNGYEYPAFGPNDSMKIIDTIAAPNNSNIYYIRSVKGTYMGSQLSDVWMYNAVTREFINLLHHYRPDGITEIAVSNDGSVLYAAIRNTAWADQYGYVLIDTATGNIIEEESPATSGFRSSSEYGFDTSTGTVTIASNLLLPGVKKAEPRKDIIAKMEAGYLQKDCGEEGISGLKLENKTIVSDKTLKADDELTKKIKKVDEAVEKLLKPEAIKGFINVDELPSGMTVEKLIGEMKGLLSGNTMVNTPEGKRQLAIRYLKGYTVGDKVISHAGVKYGCVYLAEDMVRNSNPEIVAKIELHELLHHVLGDSNHVIIKEEMKEERDAVISDMLTLSKTAKYINNNLIKGLTAEQGKDVIASLGKESANQDKPSIIYVTVSPDNMMGFREAVMKLKKENPNARIILVGRDDYVWTSDYRAGIMRDYKDIVAGFVTEIDLNTNYAGADLEAKVVDCANKLTDKKVDVTDIAWINSANEEFQVAKVFKNIPVVGPQSVQDVEFNDVKALFDVAQLMIRAHRIAGENFDFETGTFKELASYLGPELEKKFLSSLTLLGLNVNDKVALGLDAIPPTQSVTKDMQIHVNSLREMLTAA